MAVTIHSLVYKTIMDSREFTKGSLATRSELAASKKLWMESRTDAERYGLSVDALGKLHQKGVIDAETHRRSIEKLNNELKGGALKGPSFAGIGGLLGQLGLGVSIARGVGALKDSVAAAEESIESEKRLAAVLEATGNTTGMTAEQILDYSNKLRGLTGISDEAFTDSAAALASFGNIGGKVFKDAIRLAADLSRVFKSDLSAETENLGRALSNPIEAINRLRLGTERLTKEEKELITSLAESGDLAGAQAEIIRLGLEKVGGAAEKMRTPIQGLKSDLGELSEEFGKLFTETEAGKDFWNMMAQGARATAEELANLREGKGFGGVGAFGTSNQQVLADWMQQNGLGFLTTRGLLGDTAADAIEGPRKKFGPALRLDPAQLDSIRRATEAMPELPETKAAADLDSLLAEGAERERERDRAEARKEDELKMREVEKRQAAEARAEEMRLNKLIEQGGMEAIAIGDAPEKKRKGIGGGPAAHLQGTSGAFSAIMRSMGQGGTSKEPASDETAKDIAKNTKDMADKLAKALSVPPINVIPF